MHQAAILTIAVTIAGFAAWVIPSMAKVTQLQQETVLLVRVLSEEVTRLAAVQRAHRDALIRGGLDLSELGR